MHELFALRIATIIFFVFSFLSLCIMKIHDSYERALKRCMLAVSDCFFAFPGLFIDGLLL